MSIIPKEEIDRLIENGLILVDPNDPSKKFIPKKNQIQPASIDLTIGIIFRKEKRLSENSSLASVTQYDKQDEIVELAPGEIVTILTNEMIKLPPHIAATLFPPNSLSVKGVLILNPGHVDPGYSGRITVRLINFKEAYLPLRIGDFIFTMTLEEIATKNNSGHTYTLKEYDKNLQDDQFIDFMRESIQGNMGQAVFDISATSLVKDFNQQYISHSEFDKLTNRYVTNLIIKIIGFLAGTGTIITILEKGPEIVVFFKILSKLYLP
jgi:deoxycytidine triphosphate deaminase